MAGKKPCPANAKRSSRLQQGILGMTQARPVQSPEDPADGFVMDRLGLLSRRPVRKS